MKIAIASDHGGFELKEIVKKHLQEDRKIEVIDLGTNSKDSVDYPIYGHKCAKAVANKEADLGIVCCGTGIGISISANKVSGIRCALLSSAYAAEFTKRHNNANMVTFGGRTTSPEDAILWTDIWLDTPFEGGRHQRRIDLIEDI